MPGVVAAGAEHAGGVGGCGDAYTRAEVAEIARVLEQDDGQRPRVGEHVDGLDLRALGESDHAGGGRERSELLEHGGFDSDGPARVDAVARNRASTPAETIQLGRVAARDLDQFAPKRSAFFRA